MAVHGKIFGLFSVVGHFRNVLLNRNVVPLYQQTASLKQTIEEKLGLPRKPKKPLTPYFRFMAEVRPAILEKNPQIKSTDIIKAVAKEWETADATIRQRLEAEYKNEMTGYIIENQKYEQMLTQEQRNEIKKAKLENAERKEKRKLKKKKKELGRPKRPISPFLMFLEDNKEKRGDLAFSDWQTVMSKEWEKLSEEKKSQYLNHYRKSIEGYRREMQIWEEKMIRLGHIDLVRNEALIEPKDQTTKGPRRSKRSEE